MVIFKKNLKRKSDPNIHQIAPFKKNSWGSMRCMLLPDMEISKS